MLSLKAMISSSASWALEIPKFDFVTQERDKIFTNACTMGTSGTTTLSSKTQPPRKNTLVDLEWRHKLYPREQQQVYEPLSHIEDEGVAGRSMS